MTVTVLSATGDPVMLSPTGERALRDIAAESSGCADLNAVHPATRHKLIAAGLIEIWAPRANSRALSDSWTLVLTPAGVAAVEGLDQ